MVFDKHPVEDGSWVIIDELAYPLKKSPVLILPTTPRFDTHFATCTNPGRFRK